MDLEQIRKILEEALVVRIPMFDPSLPGREKVAALEEHIRKTAWHAGQCEEALHWAIEAGKRLRAQWDGVAGYEQFLTGTARSRPSKDAIDAAKAQIQPDLWTGIQECRTLVESLRRQVSRLGGSDYDAASRAYTLLSGS